MKMLKILIIVLLVFGVAGYSSAQEPTGPRGSGSQSQAGGSGGAAKEDDSKKTITETLPLIEVRRLEKEEALYSVELRGASLADFFRLIAHDYDFNVLVDEKVQGIITASFTNVTLEEALSSIADVHGLLLEKKGKVIRIKPNLITRAIVLNHIDAGFLLDGVAAASAGSQGTGSSGSRSSSRSSGSSSGSSGTGSLATVYDLLSPLGKILLGQQRNMIMVIDYPDNVDEVEAFVKAVDGRMGSKVFKLKYISSKELASDKETEEEKTTDYELGTTTSGN